MKILFAASECTPIAKVGGLGDVIGALPKALHALGIDVRIALPYYEKLRGQDLGAQQIAEFSIIAGGTSQAVQVFITTLPGANVPLYLFENKQYLSRGEIYFDRSAMVGTFAEIERFAFFSLAVQEFLKRKLWEPDIVHAHDWHVGMLPKLSRAIGYKTVFTIHNLQNQGRWNAREVMNFIGDAYVFTEIDADVNFIAEGIRNGNKVTAVSPRYAKEILTPEFGEGLEAALAQRKNDLVGIVNGIDADRFNPSTDSDILSRYDEKTARTGKAENKRALQKELDLAVNDRAPLFVMVSRFVGQKGVDLVVEAAAKIVAKGGQIVLLGTGDPTNEKIASDCAASFPGSVFCKIGFDAGLAQRMYAAGDFFLMPSRFEPCGLGQLIAMRYGTVPIVRDTGGLHDTVEPYGVNAGTGFIFKDFSNGAFLESLDRAFAAYHDAAAFEALRRRDMVQDFSWTTSAKKYMTLYQKLLR